MKRVYLCGPMSGIENFNRPAFYAEADRLRALGYEVISPAEICNGASTSWQGCVRLDIAALMTCDTLAALPCNGFSKGVMLERFNAFMIGIKIVDSAGITEKRKAAK